MKFSWEWVCDYLEPVEGALEKVEDILLRAGVEVEGIKDMSNFAGFEIVTIQEINKHPNAGSLNICKLNNKKDQVVCGAKNIFPGMKCVLANIGTIIPSIGMALEEKNIRGVVSRGMLCSGGELGLQETEGLIEISENIDLTKLLLPNGPVFDLAITPNRGDLLSVYGIARELSAFGLGRLLKPNLFSLQLNFEESKQVFEVIDNESTEVVYSIRLNSLYSNKTPDWMKIRLNQVGMNSHSAIIDITNYVAHSLGQPLHAFDADRISKVYIQKCTSTEFKDLKGNTHQINDLTCMESDDACISIPGVIGGDNSKVDINTRNILLEAGVYSVEHIYEAQKQVCTTEASKKFFYGIDPNMTRLAILEAASLASNICKVEFGKATVTHGIHRENNQPNVLIMSDLDQLNIDESFASHALTSLGFIRDKIDNNLYYTPTWRRDISTSQDLFEEVVRIYGYDNIEEAEYKNQKYNDVKSQSKNDYLKKILLTEGLYEVYTRDFMSKEMNEYFNQSRELIIKNPMNQSQFCLRNTMLSSILEVGQNYSKYNWQARGIFEIGSIFYLDDNKEVKQSKSLGIAFTRRWNPHWLIPKQEFNYFYNKQVVEKCIHYLYTKSLECTNSSNSLFEYGCQWTLDGKVIAVFGQIAAPILKRLKLKHTLYIGEINLEMDVAVDTQIKVMPEKELEVVTRDLALHLPTGLTCGELIKQIHSCMGPGIEWKIFDVYPNAKINSSHRSVGIRLLLDELNHTLSSQEIEQIVKIAEEKAAQLGCQVKRS